MMKTAIGTSTLLCVIVLISSCNLPAQEAQAPLDPEVAASATLLAMTLESLDNTSGQTPIPVDTALPSETPTITPTPTSSVPMVTVSVDTNCRVGPGVVYDWVGALLVGEKAVVVGKFSGGDYWIIENPDAPGTCWLWGQYATVTGNTEELPEYQAPPTPTPTYTPTPTLPKPPANFTANKVCVPVGPMFNYQFVFTWEDKADNEDGYKIYFNGGLLASLPAGTTNHAHSPGILGPGTPFTYEVEAFNATGASAKKSVNVTCP